MTDKLSPHMRAAYEEYKREHPEEIAEAHRKAREVVFKCTSVLYSYEDSMGHAANCAECTRALGFITIDVEMPKASG